MARIPTRMSPTRMCQHPTVIWDALKAVCEQRDMKTARAIIDSAGIIVAAENMTVCYDTTGAVGHTPGGAQTTTQNPPHHTHTCRCQIRAATLCTECANQPCQGCQAWARFSSADCWDRCIFIVGAPVTHVQHLFHSYTHIQKSHGLVYAGQLLILVHYDAFHPPLLVKQHTLSSVALFV